MNQIISKNKPVLHWCGCVTQRDKHRTIYFINKCERHKERGIFWIAMQHDSKQPLKLNLGCGKDSKIGYVNIDSVDMVGVDKVHNLNKYPYPFKNSSVDYVLASNILEHLDSIIKPLEEIWRICKYNSDIDIIVPNSPSMISICDPTHKQFYNYMTFDYFDVDNDGLDYYTKARFKILKRKFRFHKLFFFMYIFNLNKFTKKFYVRFLSHLIPADTLEVKLRVVK